jgi:O-acetyl-ADP-ribose deacetylase (regulator of RNase III)
MTGVAGLRRSPGCDDFGMAMIEAVLGNITRQRVNAANVALPASSTGIFGYPPDRAARIAEEARRPLQSELDRVQG